MMLHKLYFILVAALSPHGNSKAKRGVFDKIAIFPSININCLEMILVYEQKFVTAHIKQF